FGKFLIASGEMRRFRGQLMQDAVLCGLREDKMWIEAFPNFTPQFAIFAEFVTNLLPKQDFDRKQWRILLLMFSSQLACLVLRLGVCGCARGNDECGKCGLESFRLLHLVFKFFDAQLAFNQAVLVLALDADDLVCARTTRTDAGRNFNIEINAMLCLTISSIGLSPQRFETMFQNVLAKLLELFVIVRSQ